MPRSVGFYKNLSRLGYEPHVFTAAPNGKSYVREFQRDDSQGLSKDYGPVNRVVPQGLLARILSTLHGTPLYPYFWAMAYPLNYEELRPWAISSANKIIELHSYERFKLIYASAGPYCTLEAASYAARRLHIPWVADLRDLWTQATLRSFPSRLHYLWETRLERKVLRSASVIIANTPLSGTLLKSFLGLTVAPRVIVIPNGYDNDEVERTHHRLYETSGKTIEIVHAGTLYPPGVRRSRLGRYQPFPINDTARSLLPMAHGLEALRKLNQEVFNRVKIKQVGFTPSQLVKSISAMKGLEDKFTFTGVVSRSRAIEITEKAEALLALQFAWLDEEKPVPYIPGKVYEYIATGKPIFAPIAGGDLHDLLTTHIPQAYVCDFSTPVQIAEAIIRMVQDIDHGNVGVCDRLWLETYSREQQSKILAQYFDNIISEQK